MTHDTIRPLFTWRSAICESNLAPTTRHVALTLALYMSERGRNTHPDAARLANDTGLHITTVRAELGRLVHEGWLLPGAGALQPTQPAPATNRDTA